MRIILTSFKDSVNWGGPKFSTARWQPSGYSYLELRFLAPFDLDTGRAMVHLTPALFKERYERLLDSHAREIVRFLTQQTEDQVAQVVLCCWCNRARQPNYSHLYCHTVLLGWWLESHSPEVEVVYADGRERDWFADIPR